MHKILQNLLLISPTVLGMALAVVASTDAAEAQATEVVQSQTVVLGSLTEPTTPANLKASLSPATPLSDPVPTETKLAGVPTPGDSATTPVLSSPSLKPNPMAQVTSVSQLSDVQPTDWAFQALQSLVERYGCIAGYPDGTYKGNRAMTRYEFAAGLNACLDRVNELIAAGTTGLATKEDLATLQKLQEEFAAELATLRGRVDNLEARTNELERTQFSTTTKLAGEVIFTIADAFGDFPEDGDTNTVFNDRIRLNFLTSFTGKDRLRTRLQAGNATRLLSNASIPATRTNYQRTNEGNFPYDGGATNDSNNSGNDVILDVLDYRFPVGQTLSVDVFANGGLHHYYADTVNPYFEGNGGGQFALSRFAERNPIYRIGPFGAGVGVNYKFSNSLKLDFGYLSNTASNPGTDAGFLNGNFSALAQLVVGSPKAKIAFTYVHGYERNDPATTANNSLNYGGTGTTFANLNLFSLLNQTAATRNAIPVVSDSYGVEGSLQVSPKFVINGWVGYTAARLIGLGDADIWNFAVAFGFPDLGKKGNLLGIVVGAEPTLRNIDVPAGNLSPSYNGSKDFAFHIEAFYKYQLTNNISITPGIIYLPSVNQNSGIPGQDSNEDVFVGALRTTFTF